MLMFLCPNFQQVTSILFQILRNYIIQMNPVKIIQNICKLAGIRFLYLLANILNTWGEICMFEGAINRQYDINTSTNSQRILWR